MKTSFLTQFGFTRHQRNGILLLCFFIAAIQVLLMLPSNTVAKARDPKASQWLALQHELDSLKKASVSRKPVLYPFNPNFITDYKGYRLGMNVAEIHRLAAFRAQGKFVNSAREFQHVTHISDSLLHAIAPFFKFPEWVNRKREKRRFYTKHEDKIVRKSDINTCDKQELMAVYGIGDALSDRILKQRAALGGFADISQVKDIWGLSPEVVEKLKQRFEVRQIPQLRKIRINEASVKELAAFPYFRYALAKSIVTYRSMNGPIDNPQDLLEIENFPVDNVKIISLYLEF